MFWRSSNWTNSPFALSPLRAEHSNFDTSRKNWREVFLCPTAVRINTDTPINLLDLFKWEARSFFLQNFSFSHLFSLFLGSFRRKKISNHQKYISSVFLKALLQIRPFGRWESQKKSSATFFFFYLDC